MKNIRFFLSENFHFLVVKFSVYMNRHVFVMGSGVSEVNNIDAYQTAQQITCDRRMNCSRITFSHSQTDVHILG